MPQECCCPASFARTSTGCAQSLFRQGSFAFESYFQDEADRVNENDDPETFKVLEQSRFRQFYPKREPRGEECSDYGDSDDDIDPSAVFDVGGQCPVE